MAIKNLFGRGLGFGLVHWIVTRGYDSGIAPPPPVITDFDGGWIPVPDVVPIRLTARAVHVAGGRAAVVLRPVSVKKKAPVRKAKPKVVPPPQPLRLTARTVAKSYATASLAKRSALDDEELMTVLAAVTLMLDDEGQLEKRAVSRIDRDRATMQSARTQMAEVAHRFLKSQAPSIAEQIVASRDRLTKADDPDDIIDQIIAELRLEWGSIQPEFEQLLRRAAADGVREGWTQIGFEANADITNQANEHAIAFAKERAAELVGMKYVDGDLVENPDAQWAITDGTRTLIRGSVAQAVAEGWSSDRLADELTDSYAFSEQRGQAIARTELARADVQGNMISYRDSGVVEGTRSVLSSEHDEDDECDDAADMGVVPLGDDRGGLGDPPYHVACECDVIPELMSADDS